MDEKKCICFSLALSSFAYFEGKSLWANMNGFERYWTRNKTSVLWWVKHKYCLTQTRRANHSPPGRKPTSFSLYRSVSNLEWSNNDFRLIPSPSSHFRNVQANFSLIICSLSSIINTMRNGKGSDHSLINSDFSFCVGFQGCVTRRLKLKVQKAHPEQKFCVWKATAKRVDNRGLYRFTRQCYFVYNYTLTSTKQEIVNHFNGPGKGTFSSGRLL